jgi:hypothetical protein
MATAVGCHEVSRCKHRGKQTGGRGERKMEVNEIIWK